MKRELFLKILLALVILILFCGGLWVAQNYKNTADNSKGCYVETINNTNYCLPAEECKTYYSAGNDNISYCMAK